MTKTDSRRYYPTALALYITYFVLGIAATIMGQYKQDFAALWGASKLADGSFDVSSVVAVIAAIGQKLEPTGFDSLEMTKKGNISADEATYRTSLEKAAHDVELLGG